MKKIKVLRIIARLNIGGPAIHAVLLGAGLDKDKFETMLACGRLSKSEGDMSYYAGDYGVTPYVINSLGRELNLFRDLAAFIGIFKLIRKYKPDIVHTHTAKAGTLGRSAVILHNFFAAKSRRIKLAHTFHGHVFSGYFHPIKARLFILIERLLAARTSRLVTVSDSVKKELAALGIASPGNIEVIPLGFDLDALVKVAAPVGLPRNIGIVGRLVPVKNHCLFLEAASLLGKNWPQVNFRIIGDGELRRSLEEHAARLEIADSVCFLGWQKGAAAAYSDLDIVVLTSLNEGTPVSLIEAMACGRAVVATDVGGVRDLLGLEDEEAAGKGLGFKIMERGILVVPSDPAAFAAALDHLLKDAQLRRRLAEKAKEFVRVKFTKERLVRDIEGLYERLMKDKV